MKKLLCVLLFTHMVSVTPVAFAEQSDGDSAGDANVARLQVKISELEEHIRKLQGAIEQNAFETKQVKAQAEKSNADIEYRLNALEKPVAQNATPASETNSATLQPTVQANTPDTTAVANLPKFTTPLEHYNYAFNLVREKKYTESNAAFTAFTKSYPKDPLIGNAYYWLGETYYVRRDYIKAADSFRLGYEAMPTGPKAADNLLKLAMSMNLLKKDREACIILKQITVKFASAGNMKQRAIQEMGAIGCNGGAANAPAPTLENDNDEQ